MSIENAEPVYAVVWTCGTVDYGPNAYFPIHKDRAEKDCVCKLLRLVEYRASKELPV